MKIDIKTLLQVLWIKFKLKFTKICYYQIEDVFLTRNGKPVYSIYCLKTKIYYDTHPTPFVNNEINHYENLNEGDIITGKLINNKILINGKIKI